MPYELMPTILVPSRLKFEQRLDIMEGKVEMVQIDITDGKFVKNKSFSDPKIASKYRISYELDLMVGNPIEFIEKWGKVKTVQRAYIHAEIKKPILPILKKIKSLGWEAGISINPNTDWKKIEKFIPYVKSVLVMAVNPGKNGAPFVPKVVNKIKDLRKAYPKLIIAVDGSVNKKTLPLLVKAGATRFAVGSAVWNTENPLISYKKLTKIIK